MLPHSILAEKRILHARQHGLLSPSSAGPPGSSRRLSTGLRSWSGVGGGGGRRPGILVVVAVAAALLVLLHVKPLYFGAGGGNFIAAQYHHRPTATQGGGGHGGHREMIYGESLGVLGGFAANTAAAAAAAQATESVSEAAGAGAGAGSAAAPSPKQDQEEEQKVVPAVETDTKKGTEGKTLVPLEAHIMSKCPDAKDCLEMMVLPAMMRVKDMVDFTLSFIGR